MARIANEELECCYCDTPIYAGEEYEQKGKAIFCTPDCLSYAEQDEAEMFGDTFVPDTFSLCSCEDRPCCGCPTTPPNSYYERY